MRHTDDREEHRAQVERVALPGRPLLDPALRQLDAALAQAVRLDGATRVHGLGEGGGDGGVTGGLGAVGGRCALEVPATADQQDGHGDQYGGGERRRGHGESAEQQGHPHHADGELRYGFAHRVGEPVDVRGDAGQQVARAGPLENAGRQPDRPYEEVLAQIGQHPLAEHGPRSRTSRTNTACTTSATANSAAVRSRWSSRAWSETRSTIEPNR